MRNFFILFCLALFLFNVFNIQRIISHLKLDSNYRFENFPWINILPRTVSVEVFTKKGFKYYKPEKLEEGFCFNSKTPCSLNNIEITNYKNYRIFKKI